MEIRALQKHWVDGLSIVGEKYKGRKLRLKISEGRVGSAFEYIEVPEQKIEIKTPKGVDYYKTIITLYLDASKCTGPRILATKKGLKADRDTILLYDIEVHSSSEGVHFYKAQDMRGLLL
jgi:hypothetical protein